MKPEEPMSELKACPFGQNHRIFEGQVGNTDEGYYTIQCNYCNGGEGRALVCVHAESRDEAVRIWNSRSDEAEQGEKDDTADIIIALTREITSLRSRLEEGKRNARFPGIKAKHTIITPTCRTNPAGGGAFQRAVEIIRPEYERIVEIRKDDFRAHLILTIESPPTPHWGETMPCRDF